MKFHIAETLQRRWMEDPPAGWAASREVGVISLSESQMLGYQPKADLMLQNAVTNRLEVILNIHQWNKDMAREDARAAWGRRRLRYFVYDRSSNLFAPSKFAAYTRIPKAPAADEPLPYNPAMTVRAYSKIPHDTPIFDGRKAWQKIASLGFQVMKASDCPALIKQHFHSWLVLHGASIHAAFDETEILMSPAA